MCITMGPLVGVDWVVIGSVNNLSPDRQLAIPPINSVIEAPDTDLGDQNESKKMFQANTIYINSCYHYGLNKIGRQFTKGIFEW